MNISPIKDDASYKSAMARIETLMNAKLNTPEGDELDILATLIETYEDKHFPIDAPDPIAAINHCMEALGMSRKELEDLIGKNRASEILNKSRKLSITMIRKLHTKMGIPADILIKDYEVRSASKLSPSKSKQKPAKRARAKAA